jgi:agmatine deiminase
MLRAPMSFVQPAEWTPHEACWVAWPSDASLWLENLEPARAAWTKMARSIGKGERLEVLVPDDADEALARAALQGVAARFHRVPFGDIWLRDTAPIFVKDPTGARATARFGFNGWGGKYVLEHDNEVAARIAAIAGLPARSVDWILEGGSIDVDGRGTCLTTRQCLLNPNRNPGMSQRQIEDGLRETLGIERTIWLGDGLKNDHTDGHVDNVARFVAPGKVVCMEARSGSDPNRRALADIARDLEQAGFEVVRIPSPGLEVPASFCNFYIGNASVVVPQYQTPYDDEALEKIAKLFPGRETIGVDSRAVLSGGGSFHCITQQVPR